MTQSIPPKPPLARDMGAYFHYKNKSQHYVTLFLSWNTTTQQYDVLYCKEEDLSSVLCNVFSSREEGMIFSRPYDEFFGTVQYKGKLRDRFTLVKKYED